jgi:acetyltransferase-like isoleucine patch superfamily enzyme
LITIFFVLTLHEENLIINEHNSIGQNFRCHPFGRIEIGKYCLFAADVTLVNGGHDPDTLIPFSGPLTIGNGCWIGSGARICGPLTIGNNAIIGAGALVVTDIPERAIVGGVPAKILGYRNLPEKVWHLNSWFSPYTFEDIS